MSSFSVTKYIGPAAIVIFVLVVIAAAFAVVMPFLAAIVWGAIVAIATWKPFCWVRDRIFRGHASAAAVSIVFLLIIVILVPFSVGVYGAYQKVADFSYSVMHSADVSQNSEEKPVPDMSLSQVLNSGVPRAFKIKALADGVAAQDKSGSEAASAGGTGILSESDGAFIDGFAGVAGTVTEGSPEDASAAGSETSESAREPAETQGTAEQAGAGERAAKGSDAAHPAEPAEKASETQEKEGQAGSAVEPADKTQDENAAAASEESADAESAGEDGNESGKDGKDQGILSRFKFKIPNLPEPVAKLPVVGPVIAKGWDDLQHNRLDIKGIVIGSVAKIPQAAGVLVTVGKALGNGAIMFALSLFFIGYFYIEGQMYSNIIDSLVERVGGEKGKIYLGQCIKNIKSVVYGLVGASLGQGITAFIGLYATGVNNAVVLSIIASIFSVVPGAPLSVGLWGCYQLYAGGETAYAIMLLFWFCCVVCTIDTFIKGFAIKRGNSKDGSSGASSMSMFLIIISVFGGAMAFGLLGVFLGPVALSLFNTMVRAYANIDGNAGAASLALSGPSSGSGAAASDEDHDASAGDRSKEAEETSGSGSPKEGEKP